MHESQKGVTFSFGGTGCKQAVVHRDLEAGCSPLQLCFLDVSGLFLLVTPLGRQGAGRGQVVQRYPEGLWEREGVGGTPSSSSCHDSVSRASGRPQTKLERRGCSRQGFPAPPPPASTSLCPGYPCPCPSWEITSRVKTPPSPRSCLTGCGVLSTPFLGTLRAGTVSDSPACALPKHRPAFGRC